MVFSFLGMSTFAQNRTVTNTNDTGTGSFRWAITSAGAGDTVFFNPTLLSGGSDTIYLLSTVTVTSGRVLMGIDTDTSHLAISGGGLIRMLDFDFDGASDRDLRINRMTFIDGRVTGIGSTGGGMILSRVDSLFLTNVRVSGCEAYTRGAGIFAEDFYSTSYPLNGRCPRYARMEEVEFDNNDLTYGGGAGFYFEYGGRLEIVNSHFHDNLHSAFQVFNYNQVIVDSTEVSNNGTPMDPNSYSAGIWSSQTVRVRNSEFVGNYTDTRAALTIDNSNNIVVRDCLFQNNSGGTGSSGGAAYIEGYNSSNLPLILRCQFNNNTAAAGGAVYALRARFDSCQFINNTAQIGGAVMQDFHSVIALIPMEFYYCEFDGNTSTSTTGSGAGAIKVDRADLVIENSSFVNQHSVGPSGVILATRSAVRIRQSTMANNTCDDKGGVIYLGQSRLQLINSTIINNSALLGGNFLYNSYSDTIFIRSSIIHNPGGTAIADYGFNAPPVYIKSSGFNLVDFDIQDLSTGDVDNADSSFFRLNPLANNGGIGKTAIPKANSWAVNRGNPFDMALPQNDSIRAGRRDIGAAESTDSTSMFFTVNLSGCDSVTYNGTVYHQPTTFMDTAAVDSIIRVSIERVNTSFDTTFTVTSCSPYTWVNGVTYSASTDTTVLYRVSAAGCDSILRLDYTRSNDTLTSSQSIRSCEPYTWIDGITYTQDNNTAYVAYTSTDGCDSLHYLNFDLIEVDTNVVVTDSGLVAQAQGASVIWYDCGTTPWTRIWSASGAEFIPTQNGSYAAVIAQGGCTDTSRCIPFNKVSLGEYGAMALQLFPNPSNGTVELRGLEQEGEVRIYSASGALIQSTTHTPGEPIRLPEVPGVYLLEWSNGVAVYRGRVVRQ